MARPPSTPPKASSPFILVADDDRTSRERAATLLRRVGMRVETAENGRAALERVTRGGVDLVVLDVVMQGLDGLETCKMIKALASGPSWLPVLLLSSRTGVENKVEGLKTGADDYLTKPFDDRELVARIEALLRTKRAFDDLVGAKVRLEREAILDVSTGLYNERYLSTRLGEEYKRAERYRDPLAYMVVGVEPADGAIYSLDDGVLREVGLRLKSTLREVDIVARCERHAIALVLPSTHFAGALSVAERVLRAVSSTATGGTGPLKWKPSIGVALFPGRDIRAQSDLERAAVTALETAKAEGGARICVFQAQGYIYRPNV